MRKIIAVVLLGLLCGTARAEVISHRYMIPGTSYSIELPKQFAVHTRDVDETSPIVTEHGISVENVVDFMQYVREDVVALGLSHFHGTICLQTGEPIDGIDPSSELPDEVLDAAGEIIASGFYDYFPGHKPIGVEGDLCDTVTIGDISYVTWMYIPDMVDGLSENYVFWDKDCMVSISMDYEGTPDEVLDAADKAYSILRTIRKEYE